MSGVGDATGGRAPPPVADLRQEKGTERHGTEAAGGVPLPPQHKVGNSFMFQVLPSFLFIMTQTHLTSCLTQIVLEADHLSARKDVIIT